MKKKSSLSLKQIYIEVKKFPFPDVFFKTFFTFSFFLHDFKLNSWITGPTGKTCTLTSKEQYIFLIKEVNPSSDLNKTKSTKTVHSNATTKTMNLRAVMSPKFS